MDLSNINDVRQVGKTINGDVNSGSRNGFSIALKNNGNTIAIGDPKFDGANTPDNGHVRIFDLQTIDAVQTWVQRLSLIHI